MSVAGSCIAEVPQGLNQPIPGPALNSELYTPVALDEVVHERSGDPVIYLVRSTAGHRHHVVHASVQLPVCHVAIGHLGARVQWEVFGNARGDHLEHRWEEQAVAAIAVEETIP